jgi:anti-sigma factor (TIGR02949 family)
MQCRDAQRVLGAFVDGYTDVPTTLELQAHLERCGQCRHEVELEYRLRQLLTAPGLWEPAPPHLRRQLQRRLTVRHRIRRSLAGVALVLLGLALVWRYTGPARSPHPVLVQLLEATTQTHHELRATATPGQRPDVGRLYATLTAHFPYRFNLPQPGDTMQLLRGISCTLQGVPCRAALYEHRGQRVSYVVFPYAQRPITAAPQARIEHRTIYAHRTGTYHVVFWSEGPVICALVADLPPPALLPLARAAIAQEGRAG